MFLDQHFMKRVKRIVKLTEVVLIDEKLQQNIRSLKLEAIKITINVTRKRKNNAGFNSTRIA